MHRYASTRIAEILATLSLVIIVSLAPHTAAAQEPAAPATEEEPAQPAETQPKFQGSSGVGGFGAMAPEIWGLVQTHLRNPLDKEAQVRIVFQFRDFHQRQFIRIANLPPRSSRSVELPARPGQIGHDQTSTATEIILFPVDRDFEMDRSEGSAIVRQSPFSFAVIAEGEEDQASGAAEIDDEAVTALTAVRLQAGLGQDMLFPTLDTTPRFDITWDAAYVVSITADRPALDAAQRRALRRWIARGGILVVWADQVHNSAMAEVVGQTWNIAEVDKVTLTSVRFDAPAGSSHRASFDVAGKAKPFAAEMSTEDPITHARVIAPDWETHLTVNGWPALLSKRLGRGRVVVSTIGGRAWTAPELKAAEGKPAKPGTVAALDRMVALLLPESQAVPTQTPAEAISGEPGRGYVTQLIGYKVVPRPVIAGVMGLFLLVFAAGGFYWHKQGHGERLGIATLFLAVITAVALVVLGMNQRGQVEPSAASVQMVQVQPGLSSVHVTGVAGMYHPEGAQVTVSSNSGGWMWPVEIGQAGDMQRLRTEDLDRWAWLDLPLAAGATRPLSFAFDLEAPQAFQSDLRYTAEGLTGSVRWPMDQPFENLILATPQANLEPKVTLDGNQMTITVGPDNVLDSGEFFSGVLSQVQQDRAAMLRTLSERKDKKNQKAAWSSPAASPPATGAPRAKDAKAQKTPAVEEKKLTAWFDQPTLLAWSRGFDTSYQIEPKLKRIDEAIWAAPLGVNPTPAGEQVLIPWPLIPMQQVRVEDAQERYGFPTMPLYRPESQEWIETSMNSGFIGRFMLPPQVLPLELTKARLHLSIRAIGRQVRILTIEPGPEGKAVELAKLEGPDDAITVDLPIDQLRVDPDGGVLLAFDVLGQGDEAAGSAITRVASMSGMWEVRHFGLEVAGTVQPQKK